MKNIKKVVFFGTHELAVPALETLEEQGLVPALIVTRPEAGLAPGPLLRDDIEPAPHPVVDWAEEHEIPLVRSRRAAEPTLHERIAELEPDLLVVADYGRPLPKELLDKAPRGALQVHPSYLPKLRGEHAIRAALSLGYRKTGATIFRVDEDPWSGPILKNEEIPLDGEETYGELVPKVQALARELLAEGLAKLDKAKNPKTRKQNPKSATKTPRITTRHRRAPWQLEAKDVFNRWRAHAPPGLVTSIKFQTFEIAKGLVMPWVNAPFGETGTYLGMRSGRMAVLCGGQSCFGIEEVRLDGEEDGIPAAEAAEALGITIGDQFV